MDPFSLINHEILSICRSRLFILKDAMANPLAKLSDLGDMDCGVGGVLWKHLADPSCSLPYVGT